MMKNSETIVYRSLFVMAAIIGLMAVWQYYSSIRLEAKEIKKQEVSVALSEVIGPTQDFRGQPLSPYTLVEFGDYECPPCRAANKQLLKSLEKHQSTLKFTFRNFPLKNIHPYAMPMAVFAETARSQGKYWQVHDMLYTQELNEQTIGLISKKLGIDQKIADKKLQAAAYETVNNDVKSGIKCHINATPTFLLCCPSGKVIELNSLSQLDRALDIQ